MEIIDGDIDYGFYLTMNEVLELVVVHCERARDAENDAAMELNLKMASRAMRCALEILGTRVRKPEEKNV
jgi:hypothetical protein